MLRRERRDVRAFHARVENLVAVCRPVGLKMEISGRALRNADVGLRGRAVAARPAREGVTRSRRLFQPECRRFQGVCRRVRLARLQRAAVQLIIDGIRLDLGLRRQRDSARHGHGIWVIRLSVAPLRKRIACANRRFNFQLVQQVHGKHAAVLGIVRCVVHLIADAGNARVPVQLHVTGHCAGLCGQAQRRVCTCALEPRQFARLVVAQLPHGRVKARPREDLRVLSINQAVVHQNILAVFIVNSAIGHGLIVHLHAAPRVNIRISIRPIHHSAASIACHSLPQRHALLNALRQAGDTSAIPSADISCRIAAPDARPNKVTSDNSACIRVRCDDLARRIAILKRAFLHIADQTAHRTGSLYSSANNGAFFNACARIALTADKRANLASPLNLRIANHNVPNGRKMCIAKQACIILTSGNCQADDRMPLPVEHAGKRLIIAVVPIDIIANRHPVQPGKIDVVRQQIGFAALAVARVHLVGELFELLGRGDVNRGSVAEHPAGQFAALFALDDLQNRQAVLGVRPRVVIRKNLGELRGERAAVADQVCAVFVVRRAVGHGDSVHLHAAPRVNVQFSIRLGQHSMAGCSCHGLPQRHASLYVPCPAGDTSAIRSADISCRIAVFKT